MNRLLTLLTAVAILASILSCSDPFTPNIRNVAGDYHLQSLTVTDLGGPRDWVALGTTLTISLGPNGTTSGCLFMPGGGSGGADLDVDMSGTWTLAVATVEFSPSFELLRDVTFIASENRLIGDHAYGSSGATVRIVLTK